MTGTECPVFVETGAHWDTGTCCPVTTQPTNLKPNLGQRVYAGNALWEVTRVNSPLPNCDEHLVYGKPVGGGPETFLTPKGWVAMEGARPEPKCSAHGDVKCAMCSRSTETGCSECSTVAEDGMHWDTCPNRNRAPMASPTPDPEWLTSLAMRTEVEVAERAASHGISWTVARRLAETAVSVAALHIHPLYRVIGDLEFDLRRQEEVVQELRAESVDLNTELDAVNAACDDLAKRAEFTAPVNDVPLQYLPLSEVTDGHVAAFDKAHMECNGGHRDCIRAGLAAIQWPTPEVDEDDDPQCTRPLVHAEPAIGGRVFNHDSGIWIRTHSGWDQTTPFVGSATGWSWKELHSTFDGHLHPDQRVAVREMPMVSPPTDNEWLKTEPAGKTPSLMDIGRALVAGFGGYVEDEEHLRSSSEMREVLLGGAREGDTITGAWSKRAPRPGKPGVSFAESESGWLVDPVVTRPAAPLPTPGQVAYEAARTERLTRRPTDEAIGWDELNEGTRSMWEAAASAVLSIKIPEGGDF